MCLKGSFDRQVVIARRFLKLPDLLILIKQDSITSQKIGSCNFLGIAYGVLNKG